MGIGRWASLERLLARQHGVVALWQVRALGLPSTTFKDHARTHGWSRFDRGLWAAPWSVPDFTFRCVVERIRGPRARLVTGGAQLVLLGVRRLEPSTIDVWVRPGVAVAARPGVRIVRAPWVAEDRVHRIDHVPCTPPLRALRDAASRSSTERLERDLRALDRLRHATPEQVRADLGRRGRFPGKPKLVMALDHVATELVHSDAEALGRGLLRRAGFQLHPRPLLVEHRGRRLGEIDIAMCRIRHGTEIDGPSHREDGQEERDRRRDRQLRQQAGWRIDRFTDVLLRTDPQGFVEAVRRGAAEAAARGLEPWPCNRCGT